MEETICTAAKAAREAGRQVMPFAVFFFEFIMKVDPGIDYLAAFDAAMSAGYQFDSCTGVHFISVGGTKIDSRDSQAWRGLYEPRAEGCVKDA